MEAEETILYTKDNRGVMREWAIAASGDKIFIRYGQCGGAMQYQTEHVSEGKATRTLDEQIMSRMASRISSQRDKGYVPNYDEAKLRPQAVNTLGLPKPMLAQKIENVKNIDYTDAIIQPKFDGNRCLIYCEDGVNKAYSRNGKRIEAIDHILQDIEMWDGMILDGELYCHGQTLQTIVSWIKRKQPDTEKLKYHLYDIVAPDLAYKRRSELIATLPLGDSISPVYGDSIASYEDALDRFRGFREQGYEGAILRWGSAGYEDGKRSKSLLKMKEWHDAEFLIEDISSSSDGWAILHCRTQAGVPFRVSAPGDMYQKKWALNNKADFIGRWVTVEFANWTKDGVPFHPIATKYRDPIE